MMNNFRVEYTKRSDKLLLTDNFARLTLLFALHTTFVVRLKERSMADSRNSKFIRQLVDSLTVSGGGEIYGGKSGK